LFEDVARVGNAKSASIAPRLIRTIVLTPFPVHQRACEK